MCGFNSFLIFPEKLASTRLYTVWRIRTWALKGWKEVREKASSKAGAASYVVSLPSRGAGMVGCLGDGQARLFSHEPCHCSVEN